MNPAVVMSALTAESAREALKAVIDPEIYQNIVDLGLVYNIDVNPENAVTVTMTLTTPHCPMGPPIIANVEDVLKTAGASAVAVNIVWTPAWTPYAMTEDLQRELGLLEPPEPEEEIIVAPPPPVKKKNFVQRLFGF